MNLSAFEVLAAISIAFLLLMLVLALFEPGTSERENKSGTSLPSALDDTRETL
jgi:hypothetical protein